MNYKFQESMMSTFLEKGRRLAELERVVDDKQCDSQVQLQVEEYHDTQERVDQVLEQVKDALKQQDLSNLFLLISTLCDQLMQQNKINLKAQIQPNDFFQMQLLNNKQKKGQEILKSPKTITPKKQNNNYEPAMLTQKTSYQEQFEEKPKQKKRDFTKATREFSTQTDFHFLFNQQIIYLQQRISNLEIIVEKINFENKLKDDIIDYLQNQRRKNGMVKDQGIQVNQNHNKINPILSQKNIRHKSKLSQIDFNNSSQDEIQKKKNYSQFDLDQFCKNKKTINLDDGYIQSITSSCKDYKKSNNQDSKLQQLLSQSIQKDEDSKSSSSNMRVENYSFQNDSNSWGMKAKKDHSERQPNRNVSGQKQYLNLINEKKLNDSCYLRIDDKHPKEIENRSLVFNKIQNNKNWEKKKIKIGNQNTTFFKNSKTCSNQTKLNNKFQITFYSKLQNLDSSLVNDTNRQAKFINKSQVVGKNQDSKFYMPKNRIAQNQFKNPLNNNRDLKNKSAQQDLKFSICEAKSILFYKQKTKNKYNKSIDSHD